MAQFHICLVKNKTNLSNQKYHNDVNLLLKERDIIYSESVI